jgi:hypothetical protein
MNCVEITPNHNVVGTCGHCGGPVISPMMWGGSDTLPIPKWCSYCQSHPKSKDPFVPAWGPILEMEK